MVLGLSLTSDDVVWVLVDEADGTVIDHDVIEVHEDAEMAGAAARGARAIATNGGFDIAGVRLTWSDDVAQDGLRLRTRLRDCGFHTVEAVPFRCAVAVLVKPDTEPGLALAYGAAVAEIEPSEADTAPVTRQAPVRRRFSRTRIGVGLLGAAAAVALGGLLLSSGSVAPVEQPATAAASAALPDPGWVAVPAPSDSAAGTVRKVVELPDDDADEVDQPQPAVAVRQIQPAPPAPAAPPLAAPTGLPHLADGVPHLAAPVDVPAAVPSAEVPAAAPAATPLPETVPVPGVLPAPEALPTGEPHLPEGQPVLPSAPEMTDPAILFSALP
ncbi:hypothetical protein [Mycolicibacterium sp. BiH015]|uniref:hypothetical protein n=1 Tax=Mycolicibacterium sp. BiH015 TaxID=3018808 RepID=UPI003FA57724